MNSIRLAWSTVAFFLVLLSRPAALSSQSECDYAAWLAANPQYSGVGTPLPADSLDQVPLPAVWPEWPERNTLAEANRAGWKWDAILQVVVDTNGAVLRAEVVRLDVWADGPGGVEGPVVALDKLAAADSVGVLLRSFMRDMEFTPGVRYGVPVRAFLCPNMSAAMMPPTPRDEMGFSVIGPTFFAIQVHDDSAAAEWYGNALGLRQVNHLEADDGRYSIRNLTGGDLSVELIRLQGAAPAPTQPHLGLFKAGFFVDDIDAAFKWLRSQGVNTDVGIMIDRELQVRMFMFRDVEGNTLQVFQRCGEECVAG